MPKCLPGFSEPGSASLAVLIPRAVSFLSHLCSQVILASTTGSKLAPLSLIWHSSELGWGMTASPC